MRYFGLALVVWFVTWFLIGSAIDGLTPADPARKEDSA